MQLTFRHSLRSSRRFVFEHVCVVRRKWLQNLRVRIERPDYVEYRLTGLFYELKQEVLARGGPLDRDQGWYEFVTAVARMGVEGRLEGKDGNLMQTEVITFRCARLLAHIGDAYFDRNSAQNERQQPVSECGAVSHRLRLANCLIWENEDQATANQSARQYFESSAEIGSIISLPLDTRFLPNPSCSACFRHFLVGRNAESGHRRFRR
jgi:hypothetical protein